MPDLWSRIRKARVFQVLVVYLGASWVVLQIADVLSDALALPDWVEPVTVLLLLVGLVIITATAWLQAHPPAPPESDGRITQTERVVHRWVLPQLTWRRSLLGGLGAFAALSILTAAVVWSQSGGAAPAAAEEAGTGIAVLPFTVSGEAELEVWREGMLDLLSTNLDGAAGLRTIDPRTVLARLRELGFDPGESEQARLLEGARRAHARYALTGNIVAIGNAVRLAAELTDLEAGSAVARAHVEGSPDDVLRLVDRLSIELLRQLAASGSGPVPGLRPAESITTASVDALKAYLRGEALYRANDMPSAIDAFSAAVAADPDFALAHWGLSRAWGWSVSSAGAPSMEALYRTIALSDRLPERVALLARSDLLRRTGHIAAIDSLERAARRYPDDPEAAFLLAESYYHLGQQALIPIGRSSDAFLDAIELDPSVASYYHHVIPMAISSGDTALANRLVEQYADVVGAADRTVGRLVAFRTALDVAFGDADARTALQSIASDVVKRLTISELLEHPVGRTARAAEQLTRVAMESGAADAALLRTTLVTQGKLEEALGVIRDARGDVTPAVERQTLASITAFGRELPAWATERMASPTPGLTRSALVATATYHAERGDARALEPILDSLMTRSRETTDTINEFDAAVLASAWREVARWKSGGDPRGVIQPLENVRRQITSMWGGVPIAINRTARSWLAEAYTAVGRLDEAEKHLLSLDDHAHTHYRLGMLYERMNQPDRARRHLERFVDLWRDADAAAPEPVQAREALVRLHR